MQATVWLPSRLVEPQAWTKCIFPPVTERNAMPGWRECFIPSLWPGQASGKVMPITEKTVSLLGLVLIVRLAKISEIGKWVLAPGCNSVCLCVPGVLSQVQLEESGQDR